MNNKFDSMNKKLEGVSTKEDIQKLSKQLTSLREDLKVNNKLETRVEYLENVLALPNKK